MKLFPDENIIQESDNGSIVLTTHRLFQEEKGLGKHNTKSIMLEHITSCESHKKTQYKFFLISLIGFFMVLTEVDGMIEMGVFLVIVGLALFFLTKKTIIIIASPTSKILIYVKSMKRRNVEDFIDELEKAKHKRLLKVGNNRGS